MITVSFLKKKANLQSISDEVQVISQTYHWTADWRETVSLKKILLKKTQRKLPIRAFLLHSLLFNLLHLVASFC